MAHTPLYLYRLILNGKILLVRARFRDPNVEKIQARCAQNYTNGSSEVLPFGKLLNPEQLAAYYYTKNIMGRKKIVLNQSLPTHLSRSGIYYAYR